MQKDRKNFFSLLIIIVILGFLSGVTGELWVNGFLLPDPYLNFKNYSDLSRKIDDLVNKDNNKKDLNVQDVVVNKTIEDVRPALVQVYRYKNFVDGLPNSLMSNELLSQGVVITNDGWILSSSKGIKSAKDKFYVVLSDHKVYETTQIVSSVEENIAFLKIEAINLPVIEFNLRNDLLQGQAMFLFGADNNVINANLKNLNFADLNNLNDYIHSSEIFYKYLLLDQTFDEEYLSSPIVTLNGKMAGLVLDNKTGLVLPIDHIKDMMKNVVQNQEWTRPYLGIKFNDLSEMLNPLVEQKKGALIVRNGIAVKSPAVGKLLVGDIILKVEQDEISNEKNLPELINQYKVGDLIKLTIKRGDEEKQVEVKLDKET